ncbi:unnamed protein product [Dibothriocephalus latus]|uniref:Uncharacterized protein n=1 Tax=Dibothriocephalus latus TaxID=60516 RepID=A0A3P6T0X5_DIBLA|nr:unnamed protein product [Dibothriocephalus latus]
MEALEKRNAAPITTRPQTNTRPTQVDSLAARADALLDAGKFIDEARIAKTYNSQVGSEKPEADVVFCCLCEEDASVICHDCDDDEFCKQCFK